VSAGAADSAAALALARWHANVAAHGVRSTKVPQ